MYTNTYRHTLKKQKTLKCYDCNFFMLTLNGLIPDKVKKLSEIFIFTLLCGASKGFMKALKAFIKPFEAPQRNMKIKI